MRWYGYVKGDVVRGPERSFGDRLRALREERGWSQKLLARKSKTSQPNISRLEQGHQHPEWETVQRLALALGASPTALYPEGIRTRIEQDAALLEAAREKVRELAELLDLIPPASVARLARESVEREGIPDERRLPPPPDEGVGRQEGRG